MGHIVHLSASERTLNARKNWEVERFRDYCHNFINTGFFNFFFLFGRRVIMKKEERISRNYDNRSVTDHCFQ